MKVTSVTGFEAGSVQLILESEHPAELAMIRLMNGCEATCEAKTPEVPAVSNSTVITPDPQLVISITVKKNRY